MQVNYIALSMPRLAPYIPLYKGIPLDALPWQLMNATYGVMDEGSLFWAGRRLQVRAL